VPSPKNISKTPFFSSPIFKILSRGVSSINFSKGFGLAGFRVGYCVTNQEIIQMLRQNSQPFAVAVLSQRAAIAALTDDNFIDKTRNMMNKEREFLTTELQKRGFQVVPSQANNLLVNITKLFSSSDEFVLRLNTQGVSVVNGTNFKFLGNRFVRISPRKRRTNLVLLKVIDEILMN
jgi:histidinol-phosphate/aromatic aminotransferase/cobyric acid decarboxylase-like protein